MHKCCVFGCRNLGTHSFPREESLRKLWEAVIQDHHQRLYYNSLRFIHHRKEFQAKKHTKICSAHFKDDDYIKVGRFSGLVNTRRILKKEIAPSIFPSTIYAEADQQKEKSSNMAELLVARPLQLFEPKANTVPDNSPSCSDVPHARPEASTPSWHKPKRTRIENQTFADCSLSIEDIDKEVHQKHRTETDEIPIKVSDDALSIENVVIKKEIELCEDQTITDNVPTEGAAEDQYVPEKHTEFSCNHCMGDIIGFRYTCLQCAQYDLCGACEAGRRHPRHYVLRVPVPTNCSEVNNAIAAIKVKIAELEDALKQIDTKSSNWHHYVEIKRENDQFPIEEPPEAVIWHIKSEPVFEESIVPKAEFECVTAEDEVTPCRATVRDDSDTDDATEDWWNETQPGHGKNEDNTKKCNIIYKQTSEWKIGRKKVGDIS